MSCSRRTLTAIPGSRTAKENTADNFSLTIPVAASFDLMQSELEPADLARRQPVDLAYRAARHVAQVDVAAPAIARHVLAPARDRHVQQAAVAAAGTGDQHVVAAVGQQLHRRRRGVRRGEAPHEAALAGVAIGLVDDHGQVHRGQGGQVLPIAAHLGRRGDLYAIGGERRAGLDAIEAEIFRDPWYAEVDESVIVVPNRSPRPSFYYR